VFASVFLAELGDKTQLATLLFAATPGLSKAGVFAAAASALLASSALAVLVGGHVGAALRPELLRTVTAAAFIAIGGWMLLSR
jgi:putative Ca2+/H+ antiporter (TMEM165/GDT1 family)